MKLPRFEAEGGDEILSLPVLACNRCKTPIDLVHDMRTDMTIIRGPNGTEVKHLCQKCTKKIFAFIDSRFEEKLPEFLQLSPERTNVHGSKPLSIEQPNKPFSGPWCGSSDSSSNAAPSTGGSSGNGVQG